MNKIEQQVMAGVALAYALRRLTSRTALECYALFISAFSITILVSLPHVEQNFLTVASGGLPNVVGYVLAAVVGTKLVVQLALALGALALGLIAVDTSRSLFVRTRRFA